jgi:hypothetical protein
VDKNLMKTTMISDRRLAAISANKPIVMKMKILAKPEPIKKYPKAKYKD